MKTVNYSIRIDPEVKARAEKTFAVFGLNLSEAITVFLHKSILEYGFPFDVREQKPTDMLRESILEADRMMADPNLRGYASISKLNAALDADN